LPLPEFEPRAVQPVAILAPQKIVKGSACYLLLHSLFFNWYSGGWVGGIQLGPLGTAATNKTIVSTPGDYDDGEIGAKYSEKTCSSAAPTTTNPTSLHGRESGPPQCVLPPTTTSCHPNECFLGLPVFKLMVSCYCVLLMQSSSRQIYIKLRPIDLEEKIRPRGDRCLAPSPPRHGYDG
jgi:hypothetical protein